MCVFCRTYSYMLHVAKIGSFYETYVVLGTQILKEARSDEQGGWLCLIILDQKLYRWKRSMRTSIFVMKNGTVGPQLRFFDYGVFPEDPSLQRCRSTG